MNPNLPGNNTERSSADQLSAAAGGEQDFAFAEERKPVNRNLVALLLIALIGGAAVYIMYTHTNMDTTPSESVRMAQDKVNQFVENSSKNEAAIQILLANSTRIHLEMSQEATAGQVPLDKLAANPFGEPLPPTKGTNVVPQVLSEDPAIRSQQAVSTISLSTVVYARGNSSCVLKVAGKDIQCRQGNEIKVGPVIFKVKSIKEDRVVLKSDGGEFLIFVKGASLEGR